MIDRNSHKACQTASSLTADEGITVSASSGFVFPPMEASPLVRKVQRLEAEFDELFAYLKDARADLRLRFDRATLRSREEVSAMWGVSLSQIYRWTVSGELRVTRLDRKPRYRLEDLEAFVEARVQKGKPLNRVSKAEPCASQHKSSVVICKRKNMKKEIIS